MHPIETASRRRILPLLTGATILASAFLLFSVQPLIAKLILPWFGGSAAVWTTCLLFFQVVLLGGYAYAHWLSNRSPKQQVWIHCALLAVSLISLPILPAAHWKQGGADSPLWRILGLLAATVGAPYFLLASTSPLIQSWYSRARSSALPWRFFAISNAGSLAGLLSYPFLIEPWLSSSNQARIWSVCYVCFAVACSALALYCRNAAGPDRSRRVVGRPPAWQTRVLWLALAASASALLMAGTNHLTQNVAPVPLLWVLPLSLYLLSFILCFDSTRWYRRRFFLVAAVIALVAAGRLSAGGLSRELPFESLTTNVAVFCAELFFLFMACHGELARLRPDPAYLTTFYLMVSAGGALGGVLVAIVAPLVFTGLYDWFVVLSLTAVLLVWLMWREPVAPLDLPSGPARSHRLEIGAAQLILVALMFWLAARIARSLLPSLGFLDPKNDFLILGLGALLALVLLRPSGVDPSLRRVTLALAAALAAGYAGLLARSVITEDANMRVMVRNFYGTLAVGDRADKVAPYRFLRHGTVLHGEQLLPPLDPRTPTTYYAPRSGVGRALAVLDKRGPVRAGLIGLGAGTLAAYVRPHDNFRFYDINPLVIRIARDQFTFVNGAPAPVDIVPGDARLSLEAEPDQNFDLIVVDAFSGDAIPVHLLTREAFSLYFRHLKPNGVLAFHTTNKYLNLPPVVLMGASERLKDARVFRYDGSGGIRAVPSEWVLVSSSLDFFDQPELKPIEGFIDPIRNLNMWTDDYSNLFGILR